MISSISAQLDRPLSRKAIWLGSLALLATYLVLLTFGAVSVRHGVMPTGDPVGQDFSNFYAASTMVGDGRAADVYPQPAFQAELQRQHPGISAQYVWSYPPTMGLLIAPLARAPYLLSLLLWTGAGVVVFLFAAWLLAPDRLAVLAAAASPALFWDVWHHQVGALCAAALAIGFFLAAHRKAAGGGLIGLLVVKPHLAVAAPFVLVAGGRWRAVLAAAAVTAALAGVSYMFFGPEVWRAFLQVGPRARAMIEGYGQLQSLMPSVFVAARMVHAPLSVAYTSHLVVAAAALSAGCYVWRVSDRPGLLTASALAACSLISPYTFAYDTTLVALAVAAVAGEVLARSEVPQAPGVLFLAWLWPLPSAAIAFLYGIQLGWMAPLMISGLCVAATGARPICRRNGVAHV